MTTPENHPLLSIITVTYNAGARLEATISNVRSQTFRDIEHIIIDGGSTDNTISIVKSAGIQNWISEKDKGIYDAMNKGIRRARGKWLIFLNAGDLLHDFNTLQKFADFASQHASADVIYGDVEVIEKDSSSRRIVSSNNTLFLMRNMICHQSIFYQRNLFEKTGLYSTDLKLISDFEHLIRVRSSGYSLVKIPLIVSRYSLDGVSADVKNITRLWAERLAVFKKRPKGMAFTSYLLLKSYALGAYLYRKYF